MAHHAFHAPSREEWAVDVYQPTRGSVSREDTDIAKFSSFVVERTQLCVVPLAQHARANFFNAAGKQFHAAFRKSSTQRRPGLPQRLAVRVLAGYIVASA
jgi:hypothetical protein